MFHIIEIQYNFNIYMSYILASWKNLKDKYRCSIKNLRNKKTMKKVMCPKHVFQKKNIYIYELSNIQM